MVHGSIVAVVSLRAITKIAIMVIVMESIIVTDFRPFERRRPNERQSDKLMSFNPVQAPAL